MVATQSTMVDLGMKAPDFALPDIDGNIVNLADFQGAPALLVAFICNHCPYVIHIRAHLVELIREYQDKGVAVVAINSNDAENYLEDSHAKMKEYDKAREYIEKAIENNGSSSSEIVEHYGDILMIFGEKEEALAQWIKAQELGKSTQELEEKIKNTKKNLQIIK